MHCSYELVYRCNHILIYCCVSVMYIQPSYISGGCLCNLQIQDTLFFLLFFLSQPPLHVVAYELPFVRTLSRIFPFYGRISENLV